MPPGTEKGAPGKNKQSIQNHYKTVQFNTSSDVKRAYFLSVFPSLFAWLCSPL
jgi:hypothetical protein